MWAPSRSLALKPWYRAILHSLLPLSLLSLTLVAVPQSASATTLSLSTTTASITFVNSSSSNSSNQGFAATSKNQDPIAAIAGDVLTVTVTLTNPTATPYTPVFTFPTFAGNLSGGIDVNGECPPTNSTCKTLNGGTSGTQTLLVQVPAGALSGDLTLTETSTTDYFTASTPIHIWASNGEPYVMPNGHLNISLEDLKVMLDQAKIAEAHAARTATPVSTLYQTTDAPLSQSLYPYNVTTADRCLTVGDLINATTATYGPTGLSNIYPFNTSVPWGMRQVDGECNNISSVTSEAAPSATNQFPTAMLNPADTAGWGAADQYFVRYAPGSNAAIPPAYALNSTQQVYRDSTVGASPTVAAGSAISDPSGRIISNEIADQSLNNPAAVAAQTWVYTNSQAFNSGLSSIPAPDLAVNATTGVVGQMASIPMVSPDFNQSAGIDSWTTLFGQFFDHGLDLIPKNQASIYIPLQKNDQLYQDPTLNLGALNFMSETRGAAPSTCTAPPSNQSCVGESVNTTTPYIDQSQSYGSHPSQNFFVREYAFSTSPTTPVTITGRLLDGTDQPLGPKAFADGPSNAPTGWSRTATPQVLAKPNGGLATWGMIKAQALQMGIFLSDYDVHRIPEIATDQYGRFIPAPTGAITGAAASGSAVGYPMMLFKCLSSCTANHFIWAAGNPTAPIHTGMEPASLTVAGPPQAGTTLYANGVALLGKWVAADTGHTFLDDTQANSDPLTSAMGTLTALVPDASSKALSINTQPDSIHYNSTSLDGHLIAGDGRVNENAGLSSVHYVFHSEHNTVENDIQNLLLHSPQVSPAFFSEWNTGTQVAPLTWNGNRLYLVARMVTEMEYQHMVFNEFARRLTTGLPVFNAYSISTNADIAAEFASAVYRLGHSMLTETIARSNPGMPYDSTSNQDISLFTAYTNPAAVRNRKPIIITSATSSGSSISYTLAAGEIPPINGSIVTISGFSSDPAVQIVNGIVSNASSTPLSFDIQSYYKADGTTLSVSALAATVNSDVVNSCTGGLRACPGSEVRTVLGRATVNDPGTVNSALGTNVSNFAFTPASAAAATAQGMTAQRSNAIDEFLTDAVRNNLLGQPTDLGALNISRGRDTGLPTLNQLRGLLSQNGAGNFSGSPLSTSSLPMYTSWDGSSNAFIKALQYQFASGANFIAAYGNHPYVTLHRVGTISQAAATPASPGTPASVVYTASDVRSLSQNDIVNIDGFSSNPDLNIHNAVISAVDTAAHTFTVTTQMPYGPNDAAPADNTGSRGAGMAITLTSNGTVASTSSYLTRESTVIERRAAASQILNSLSPTPQPNVSGQIANGVLTYDVTESGVSNPGFVVGENISVSNFTNPDLNISNGSILSISSDGNGGIFIVVLAHSAGADGTQEGPVGTIEFTPAPLDSANFVDPSSPKVPAPSPSDYPDGSSYRAWTLSSLANTCSNIYLTSCVETGVNNIDLWLGGLAESPQRGPGSLTLLGPTFGYIFQDQMDRLQNGDRFYYLYRPLGTNFVAEIQADSFSDIVRRNTPGVTSSYGDGVQSPAVFAQNSALAPSNPAMSIASATVGTGAQLGQVTFKVTFGTPPRAGSTVTVEGATPATFNVSATTVIASTPTTFTIFSAASTASATFSSPVTGVQAFGGTVGMNNRGFPFADCYVDASAPVASVPCGASRGFAVSNVGGRNVATLDQNDTIDNVEMYTFDPNIAVTMTSGGGDDSLLGGNGNDVLDGQQTTAGSDFLNGGAGNDYLNGGNGDDLLEGSSGNDVISTGDALAVDTADGGSGSDYIFAGALKDSAFSGETGNDFIQPSPQGGVASAILGGEGSDWLEGATSKGSAIINGDNGANAILADQLSGGDDVLVSHGGADTFNGQSGNDIIELGANAGTALAVNGGLGFNWADYEYSSRKDAVTTPSVWVDLDATNLRPNQLAQLNPSAVPDPLGGIDGISGTTGDDFIYTDRAIDGITISGWTGIANLATLTTSGTDLRIVPGMNVTGPGIPADVQVVGVAYPVGANTTQITLNTDLVANVTNVSLTFTLPPLDNIDLVSGLRPYLSSTPGWQTPSLTVSNSPGIYTQISGHYYLTLGTVAAPLLNSKLLAGDSVSITDPTTTTTVSGTVDSLDGTLIGLNIPSLPSACLATSNTCTATIMPSSNEWGGGSILFGNSGNDRLGSSGGSNVIDGNAYLHTAILATDPAVAAATITGMTVASTANGYVATLTVYPAANATNFAPGKFVTIHDVSPVSLNVVVGTVLPNAPAGFVLVAVPRPLSGTWTSGGTIEQLFTTGADLACGGLATTVCYSGMSPLNGYLSNGLLPNAPLSPTDLIIDREVLVAPATAAEADAVEYVNPQSAYTVSENTALGTFAVPMTATSAAFTSAPSPRVTFTLAASPNIVAGQNVTITGSSNPLLNATNLPTLSVSYVGAGSTIQVLWPTATNPCAVAGSCAALSATSIYHPVYQVTEAASGRVDTIQNVENIIFNSPAAPTAPSSLSAATSFVPAPPPPPPAGGGGGGGGGGGAPAAISKTQSALPIVAGQNIPVQDGSTDFKFFIQTPGPGTTLNPILVTIFQSTVPSTATVALQSLASAKDAAAGFPTVSMTITDALGKPMTTFARPVKIDLGATDATGSVVYSNDGITWQPVPKIPGNVPLDTLPDGMPLGYYVTTDGYTIILSTHLTQFAVRLQPSALTISTQSPKLAISQSESVSFTGGVATAPITVSTTTPATCSVSAQGVVTGISQGQCDLKAMQDASGRYLSANSNLYSIQIVGTATSQGAPASVIQLIGQGKGKYLAKFNAGVKFANKSISVIYLAPLTALPKVLKAVKLDKKGMGSLVVTGAKGGSIQLAFEKMLLGAQVIK